MKGLVLISIVVLMTGYYYLFELKYPDLKQQAMENMGIKSFFQFKINKSSILKYFHMQMASKKGHHIRIQTHLTKLILQTQSTIWPQLNCHENKCRLQKLVQKPIVRNVTLKLTSKNLSSKSHANLTVCPSPKGKFCSTTDIFK